MSPEKSEIQRRVEEEREAIQYLAELSINRVEDSRSATELATLHRTTGTTAVAGSGVEEVPQPRRNIVDL
jgi:hypothetical protein